MSSVVDFYALSEGEQVAGLTRLAQAAGAYWPGGFRNLELVKYRENAVFSAEGSDGQRVALRVHRHGYHSHAALTSELEWVRALGERGGVTVPPVLPAADDRLVVEVTDPAVPEPRLVSVLGWLTGAPAGTSEGGVALGDRETVELYEKAGVLAARLHEHAGSWERPTGFTRHAWDADGLVGDSPLWGRFWELEALTPEERELLLEGRRRARADLEALGTDPTTYGLIHADLVPENLINDRGELSLIDFDDAGHGWHLFELATALYFHLGAPAWERIRAGLVAGYRSVRPLTPDHEALIPLFLFLRGTTYLGWIQSRPETETARNLGPQLRDLACAATTTYLAQRCPAPTL